MYSVGHDEIRAFRAWGNVRELADTLLYTQDWQVREAAESAIIELGMTPERRRTAVELLTAAFDRPRIGWHQSGRQAAARALGRLGDLQTLPSLAEAIREPALRSYAVTALGELGPTDDVRAVAIPLFLGAIHDRHADVRQAVIESLSKLCSGHAVSSAWPRAQAMPRSERYTLPW